MPPMVIKIPAVIVIIKDDVSDMPKPKQSHKKVIRGFEIVWNNGQKKKYLRAGTHHKWHTLVNANWILISGKYYFEGIDYKSKEVICI